MAEANRIPNAGAPAKTRLGTSERVSAVVDAIRDMIARGDLKPGARLVERTLCSQFEMSRTPLREALRMLATEGIVRLNANRGAEVVSFSETETDALFELVAVLEGFAGEAACRNITDEQIADIAQLHHTMMISYYKQDQHGFFHLNQKIHQRIVEAAGNSVLSWIYDLLSVRLRRDRFKASQVIPEKAAREHEIILRLLQERNGPVLSDFLRKHVLNAGAVFKLKRSEGSTGLSATASPRTCREA
jgi:DNA-binding GntR family transcriptional regulator